MIFRFKNFVFLSLIFASLLGISSHTFAQDSDSKIEPKSETVSSATQAGPTVQPASVTRTTSTLQIPAQTRAIAQEPPTAQSPSTAETPSRAQTQPHEASTSPIQMSGSSTQVHSHQPSDPTGKSAIPTTILTNGAPAIPPTTVPVDPQNSILDVSVSPQEFADAKLEAAGLPAAFIEMIHKMYIQNDPEWSDKTAKIVETNVFGFLSHSDYSLHDTPRAQKQIKRYLKNHLESFRICRKRYGVNPSAIASLLWVETKHGKVMGNYPMPWVFYSLIMGSHPRFVHSMLDLLPEKLDKSNPKNLTLLAAQQKVIDRCKSKADWALEELKAIQQIQFEHDFNPFRQKASFAGAFGIPQFIPTSYLKLAVSGYRKKADLFKHSDAILSVAHFLKSYGWKDNDPDSQTQALYNYNHSKDYGAVILKLAQEVAPTPSAFSHRKRKK